MPLVVCQLPITWPLESGTDAMLNALFDPDDVEAEQTVILASSGPPP